MFTYLDTLTDEMLYEKTEKCTRMELPMWVSETGKYVDDGIFFGRCRKGKIKL